MNIYELKNLMSADDVLMLKDNEGNLHPLSEGLKLSDIQGAEIIKVTGKENVYRELFGKVRISSNDVRELVIVYDELKAFILANSTYQTRKKFEEILK